MPTVEQHIAALRAQVGKTENPPGSNCQEYSHELGRPCEKWCDDFQVCMARRTGLRVYSQSASTPTSANEYKAAGRWGAQPRLGAMVFWGHNPIHHISCITQIDADGTFLHIGGNTAHDSAHVNPNGGGVWENKARIGDSEINGYGYPDYDIAPPHPQPHPQEDEKVIVYVCKDTAHSGGLEIYSDHGVLYGIPDGADAGDLLAGGAVQVALDPPLFDAIKAKAGIH